MGRRCLDNVPQSRMVENHPTPPRSILQKVNAVLAWPFALLIKAYRVISPLKKYLLGSTAGCRFHPTCSAYALECLRRFPLPVALWKSLRRIARCNPLNPGGYDPVYPKEERQHDHAHTC